MILPYCLCHPFKLIEKFPIFPKFGKRHAITYSCDFISHTDNKMVGPTICGVGEILNKEPFNFVSTPN